MNYNLKLNDKQLESVSGGKVESDETEIVNYSGLKTGFNIVYSCNGGEIMSVGIGTVSVDSNLGGASISASSNDIIDALRKIFTENNNVGISWSLVCNYHGRQYKTASGTFNSLDDIEGL